VIQSIYENSLTDNNYELQLV